MTKLSVSAVRAKMLEKAAGSLLDTAAVKKLLFRPCTATEAAKLHLPTAAAGFLLPYFTPEGKATRFFRYRYLEETRQGFALMTGQKALKYGQPYNTINEIYLPPFIDWAAYLRGSGPLVITEGELKAACATLHEVPTIGLGGVWCFMSKRSKLPLLPQLQAAINWKDRLVIVCYDSDAVTNPDVLAAEGVLAKNLTALGADVRIARIPVEAETKLGIDDYIVKYGASAFQSKILSSAFPYAECAALHELSSKVVYIRELGMVYSYEHGNLLQVTAFTQHAYANHWYTEFYVDGHGAEKARKVQTAKKWLEWPARNELLGLTYAPGQEAITPSGHLNTWKGWGVKDAVKGDVQPWKDLLAHVFTGAPPEVLRYFEQICAYPIQHPGYKMSVAPVIWGVVEGSGKTLVGHCLMKLYGKNSTEIKDSHLEDGRFEWAKDKQFVLGDDITGHDNRKFSRQFMTMITQKEIWLNIKYVPSYSIPDCINYYFTSNDPDAFFMADEDRRFFIWEVLAGKLPKDLRDRVIKWRESKEGPEALMYHLMNLDMTGFDPQAEALYTSAKKEMQLVNKTDLGAWVAALKEDPSWLKLKGDLFTAEELHVVYDPLSTKRASANALARELKRAGFKRPSTESPLRAFGKTRSAFAVRNREYWLTAKWNDACKHYEDTHAMISDEPKKEKF